MTLLLQNGRQMSLISSLRNRLSFAVSLLIGAFILSVGMSLVLTNAQESLGDQSVALHNEANNLLLGMVNQETALRGYIVTDNITFLGPLRDYRPVYLAALQQLQAQLSSGDFAASAETATVVAQSRATDWYTQFALVQLQNMQSGNLSVARSVVTANTGKALFDNFRATIPPLQLLLDQDIAALQQRLTMFLWLSWAFSIAVALAAIIMILRVFVTHATTLRQQLDVLVLASTRLEHGDLTARATELTSQELHVLGLNVNALANSLEQQHRSLEQRDVMENVLRINTTLAGSLDLQTCIEDFLETILSALDLHFGVLYLYQPEQKRLTLFTSLGTDRGKLAPAFEPGEGVIGRAALSRMPLYFGQATQEVEGAVIKLMSGQVTPQNSYYLPLLRGDELLGVLGVGSAGMVGEKACNVLNVVVSNLSAMISNASAYQHIQAQAYEQEHLNIELLQQRDEMSTLNRALEEANRARSQFLATMSHELRTPLASIIGFTQILREDAAQADGNQQQQQDLERILKNSHHLLGLINDVLDLSKIEAGRMVVSYSEVDVRDLLTSVVEEIQPLALAHHLILSVEVEEGVTSLESNPVKLRQILINLVSNAIKFTEHGEVTVSARRVNSPDGEANHLALAVQDSGVGIPADVQKYIFEAFYQVDGSYTRKVGGTGLGLSIVRQLTTLLGGTIDVTSVPGQGSAFTVLLPIQAMHHNVVQDIPRLQAGYQPDSSPLLPSSEEFSPEPLQERYAVPALREVAEGQNQLVLAVDDNLDATVLLKETLKGMPYTVVGVQDPSTVMDLVHELHPCAIILDVMMPHLNGWQLLHQLKENPATASIPVVMLTVLSEPTTGYVLGADAYLIKPFQTEVLLSTLQHVLAAQKNLAQDSARETQPV